MNIFNLKEKLVLTMLAAMLILLQYTLWGGKQNIVDLYHLDREVDDLRSDNVEFQFRNDQLHEDVIDIKHRIGAIEAQARFDLGLIKPGETYYQIDRSGAN